MSIKLIGIDVDGTLVGTNNEVPATAWQILQQAHTIGIKLAICSGRPALGNALNYAHKLNPTGWHIFQNGASILNIKTQESISIPFSQETLQAFLQLSRSRGWLLETYSDFQMAQTIPGSVAERHAALLGIAYQPQQPEALSGDIVRVQWVVPPQIVPDVIQATKELGSFDFHPAGSPVMTDVLFISVTPSGVNKGSALEAVAQQYGYALSEVMAVGDGENDLYALKKVGLAVAMGNAEESVKAAAHVVVGHVDQGGLCEAIELAIATREPLH